MGAISRTAVVTGANKGVGLAIVRNLALQYPSSSLHSGPFLIYLTARSAERGAEAVKALNNDSQLKLAKVLAQDGGETTIKFKELDIASDKSIHAFRDFLKKEHSDGIDVVVNNAGVALNGFDSTVVKDTLAINYYGTLTLTQDLIPLMRKGGRIVQVASIAGELNYYSPAIRQAFISAAETSVEASTDLMKKFQSAVDKKKEKEEGWPSAAYSTSKAGLIAATKFLAKKNADSVRLEFCCPGWVNTDMTKGRGKKTPDEGAKTPVMLALGELKGEIGDFWQNEKVIPWYPGELKGSA